LRLRLAKKGYWDWISSQDPGPCGNFLTDMSEHNQFDAGGRVLRPHVDWSSALEQHTRWLRVVLLARIGEAQAIDEVMQEIGLAIARQRTSLADPKQIAPWLYRVAIRQALLYRRRCGRTRRLVRRYQEQYPGEGRVGSDPLDWLLADEQRKLVRDALNRIPPRDAELLLLKYTQGWSYRQLAEHLGTSQSAIESRLVRARRRIRDELCAVDAIRQEA
jgi:RNA polymerase sigma-70 factor (ECF subfamily)